MDQSLPSNGIFSHATLMLNTDATGERHAEYLKRAAILFENLVLVSHGFPVGGTNAVISKDDWLRMAMHDTIAWPPPSHRVDEKPFNSISKILLTDHEVFDGRSSVYEYLWPSDNEAGLWNGRNSEAFLSWVRSKEPSQAFGSDAHEYHKFLIGSLNSDWNLFRIVEGKFHSFSGLLTPLHAEAVRNTWGTNPSNPAAVSELATQCLGFDFSQLSWVDIVRLRESGFANDYRKIVAEWALAGGQDDRAEIKNQIAEAIKYAQASIIRSAEPNLSKTALSAFGSLAPVPNPLSAAHGVISGVRDLLRTHQLKKRYGWLFFVNQALSIHQEASDPIER